jgi:thymidylate synthase (FAD)
MKLINSSYSLISPKTQEDFILEAMIIEEIGRTCYKSEDKITEDSWRKFVSMLKKSGHHAMLEHGIMSVRFVCDRGVSHELVRHRLCAFAQESTRYCNYSKEKFGNELSFIKPSTFENWGKVTQDSYITELKEIEKQYLFMVDTGCKPQEARAILPNSLKTEICVTANWREWSHIFQLRAIEKAAHPDIRALMLPLYNQCRLWLPEVFDLGDPE